MKIQENTELKKENGKVFEETVIRKEYEDKDVLLTIEILERDRKNAVNLIAGIDQRLEKLKSMKTP